MKSSGWTVEKVKSPWPKRPGLHPFKRLKLRTESPKKTIIPSTIWYWTSPAPTGAGHPSVDTGVFLNAVINRKKIIWDRLYGQVAETGLQ